MAGTSQAERFSPGACSMSFRIAAVFFIASLLCGHEVRSMNHSLLTQILQRHVHAGMVDYEAIKREGNLDAYLLFLQQTDPDTLKETRDRLAFWINVYNAFTIKLIIDRYPVRTIREISKEGVGPWDIKWIVVQRGILSLNQIEHEIIRKEFQEPRIHMALVCAAVSCPPLRSEAYEGRMLEEQLSDNARRFFRDSSKNRFENDTLYLSELMEWYGDDFTPRYRSAARYALMVMDLEMKEPRAIRFLRYDWRLNSVQAQR
jgi:hypothetical protein